MLVAALIAIVSAVIQIVVGVPIQIGTAGWLGGLLGAGWAGGGAVLLWYAARHQRQYELHSGRSHERRTESPPDFISGFIGRTLRPGTRIIYVYRDPVILMPVLYLLAGVFTLFAVLSLVTGIGSGLTSLLDKLGL
jgi:hypothetical protein